MKANEQQAYSQMSSPQASNGSSMHHPIGPMQRPMPGVASTPILVRRQPPMHQFYEQNIVADPYCPPQIQHPLYQKYTAGPGVTDFGTYQGMPTEFGGMNFNAEFSGSPPFYNYPDCSQYEAMVGAQGSDTTLENVGNIDSFPTSNPVETQHLARLLNPYAQEISVPNSQQAEIVQDSAYQNTGLPDFLHESTAMKPGYLYQASKTNAVATPSSEEKMDDMLDSAFF